MPSTTSWKVSDIEKATYQGQQTQHKLHSTNYHYDPETRFNPIISQCIDKATSLLADNLTDESRYLMFEWQKENHELTLLVTDDAKAKDSIHIVKCQITGLTNQIRRSELSQQLKETIHNYLTTCSGFMQYSLIAVFHDSSRDSTTLI
jgi:hypothetical protein